MMNPSRHQLPQKVSPDRQRARGATRKLEQQRFVFAEVPLDPPAEAKGEDPRRQLPPRAREIPPGYGFPRPQMVQLGLAKYETKIKAMMTRLRFLGQDLTDARDYQAIYEQLGGDPRALGHWRLDAELGRQRLDGVNPMHLRRLAVDAPTPLWEAAAEVLVAKGRRHRMDDLFKQGRLYVVDYSILSHPVVQDEVKKAPRRGKLQARLAAPTCLFWEDDDGRLMPLSIQLKPPSEANNPVITPLHKQGDWQMARAHVACADGTLHEGYYHLLETHLVNEAVAVCMYRQLHPDHPVRQLLTPHYQGTLAINSVARGHLLSTEGKGGPIQQAMAGGVRGTLNAAALAYRSWRFSERGLHADIRARGMNEIRNYHYRDDARDIHAALSRFVRMFLGLWYTDDDAVVHDYELQDFVCEVGWSKGGTIPGFPMPARRTGRGCGVCGGGESCKKEERGDARVDTRAALFELITDLVFRAGPQHAAVNNGQYDTYGEAANGPGRLHGDLPDEIVVDKEYWTEDAFWRLLPDKSTVIQQMAMVWVLSLPTRRSILQTGQFPDLDPSLSLEAVEAIASLRRSLQSISYDIEARNEALAVPYRYLDPQNVSLSTDV